MRSHRPQPTRLPSPWDSPGKNTGVGCHFLLQCMKVKNESEVVQSCPTLSDPMDYSLPASSIHGVFQNKRKRSVLSLKKCLCVCSVATERRRQWQPTPVFLPGKSHRRRSPEDCSPWGRGGSDMTEWLPFHFPLSFIGEGNGNPLQCSCLENPRDGRAWWAAVYGVSQSRTRLKWLSSSSIQLLKE